MHHLNQLCTLEAQTPSLPKPTVTPSSVGPWPRELSSSTGVARRESRGGRGFAPVSPLTWLNERKFTQKNVGLGRQCGQASAEDSDKRSLVQSLPGHSRARLSGTLVTPVLERLGEANPWGSLATQPSLLHKPQITVRDPVSQNKGRGWRDTLVG